MQTDTNKEKTATGGRGFWWARRDSNPRLLPCEGRSLRVTSRTYDVRRHEPASVGRGDFAGGGVIWRGVAEAPPHPLGLIGGAA